MPTRILTILVKSFMAISISAANSLVDANGKPLAAVRLTELNVALIFSPPLETLDTKEQGTLYIAEHALAWTDGAAWVTIDYPTIIVHAISRAGDQTSPLPCVYCQLQSDAHSEELTEMRLIPSNPENLDLLFQEMSHCAGLNPDPLLPDQMGDSEWFTADSFPQENTEDCEDVRMAAMEHLSSVFGIATRPDIAPAEDSTSQKRKQFEDAAEDIIR